MAIVHRPISAATRQAVSRLVARYFLVHLHAELNKSDAILYEDYPQLPVRDICRDLIERTQHEFSIAPEDPVPAENLFRTWSDLNGKFVYEEGAFINYNMGFIARLLDLRDGTPESRDHLRAEMRAAFGRFDYEKQGFTVAFLLESEGNMRELLRAAVRRRLPDIAEEADKLVMVQSRGHQLAMYEYFEGLFKQTLAENVRLLHGILPEKIADELKLNGRVAPVLFSEAAVLFTDFEKFSQIAARLKPCDVIGRLDTYFTEFDRIAARHGLEKIKTIGDSYMAVAGVPEAHDDAIRAVCNAALEIRDATLRISESMPSDGWRVRIGLHVGPLIAGVIGRQKFSYDVWGATVNLASRMESSSEPGQINVSAELQERAAPWYHWQPRGLLPVKRLGDVEMFFLLGRNETATAPAPSRSNGARPTSSTSGCEIPVEDEEENSVPPSRVAVGNGS
jgi:class 3 adenylate cyclase